jgi:hypothetical protein
MNILTKAAKSLGPRIIGSAVSLLAGWIFAKSKGTIQVDPQQVVEIGTTMIGSYAVTHRIASALGINPGDAASATLAKAEKVALDTGTAVVPAPPVK